MFGFGISNYINFLIKIWNDLLFILSFRFVLRLDNFIYGQYSMFLDDVIFCECIKFNGYYMVEFNL